MSGAPEGAVERGPNHYPRGPLLPPFDTLSGISAGGCARTNTKFSLGISKTKKANTQKISREKNESK